MELLFEWKVLCGPFVAELSVDMRCERSGCIMLAAGWLVSAHAAHAASAVGLKAVSACTVQANMNALWCNYVRWLLLGALVLLRSLPEAKRIRKPFCVLAPSTQEAVSALSAACASYC